MKTRIAVVSLVLLVLILVALLGLFQRRGREIITRGAGSDRRGTILDRKNMVLAEDIQKPRVKAQDSRPEDELNRAYPLGETVACVIGFTSPGEGRNGAAGLESGLDSALGRHGEVRLTIDADVQRAFFRTLQRYVGATRAAHGSAMEIASATGEILALAEYPGPDPAKARIYPPEVWESRVVTEAFSAEAGGRWPVNENWRQTAEALRFGRAVGIGLPDETAGMLSESASTTRVSLLQLVQAYSILAEDGRLNRPHLVTAQSARRRTTTASREQIIPSTDARELLAQLADAPPAIPDTAAAKDAERVLVCVGVFPAEGQKYVIGAMLDQPFAGHYTLETARQLVTELAQKVSIQ